MAINKDKPELWKSDISKSVDFYNSWFMEFAPKAFREIRTITAKNRDFPLLIEAKSAGDFANVNKRRKEEGQKITQLKASYGNDIDYALFLNGYFDSGYLGYEAAEGIDWIWEHRIDDLGLYRL